MSFPDDELFVKPWSGAPLYNLAYDILFGFVTSVLLYLQSRIVAGTRRRIICLVLESSFKAV